MKTIFCGILLCLIFSTAYSRQSTITAYSGLISPILRGDEKELLPGSARFARRFAFQGGVSINFPISELVKFSTGLGYAQRGALIENAQNSVFNPTVTFSYHKVKIDYLEIPMLFSLGSDAFSVILGPQLAFVTKSDIRGIKSEDLGFTYGAGFGLGRYAIAQLLFYHGLTNLTGTSEVKMYNRYISLVVGAKLYRFKSKDSIIPDKTRKKKGSDVPHRTLD